MTGLNELNRRDGKVGDISELSTVLILWPKGSRYFNVHGHRHGCCCGIFAGGRVIRVTGFVILHNRSTDRQPRLKPTKAKAKPKQGSLRGIVAVAVCSEKLSPRHACITSEVVFLLSPTACLSFLSIIIIESLLTVPSASWPAMTPSIVPHLMRVIPTTPLLPVT